jgi:pilus assembly protein Flp/PilA
MPRRSCLGPRDKGLLIIRNFAKPASKFLSAEFTSQKRQHPIVSLAATNISGALQMKMLVLRFINDDIGATAIEYGLIAAGISIAIIAAVNSIGTSLNSTFSSISSQLK